MAARMGEWKRPEFADFVMSLGSEARRLAQPVRVFGAVSLAAALLCWFLWFYSYAFDSFKSLGVSLVLFAFVLTPGVVLLWLGSSLTRLALLPGRLTRAARPAPSDGSGEPSAAGPAPTRWLRIRARIDSVLELWEHLSFSKDELQELAGPSRSMAFLAHPVCAFLVALSLPTGALITLGTIFAALASLVSRIV
jgi:hypothetical protein